MIESIEDFKNVSVFGQGNYSFKQVADIEFPDNNEFFIPYFTGCYDGNNMAINNFNLNSSYFQKSLIQNCVNAEIFNLNIYDFELNTSSHSSGFFTLVFDSEISYCNITGSVIANNSSNAAGIATGGFRSTFESCNVEVSIYDAFNYVGGVVGWSEHCSINNCNVSNSLIKGSQNVGGITGFSKNDNITNCNVNNSRIRGNYNVAGIVGNSNDLVLSNCHSDNKIKVFHGRGAGIIGLGVNVEAYDCTSVDSLGASSLDLDWMEIINASFNIGGFAAELSNSIINNCSAKNEISGISRSASFIYKSDNSEINSCYSISSLRYNYGIDISGFIGVAMSSRIENCYNASEFLSVSNTQSRGFIDDAVDCETKDCFINGDLDNSNYGQGASILSTEQMKNIDSYTNISNNFLDESWDFVGNPNHEEAINDYWAIDPEINDGYPYHANPLVSNDNNEVVEINLKVGSLIGNYPNPFSANSNSRNSETLIKFNVSKNSKVEINVYNLRGQKIKKVVNKDYESGTHTIYWNGKDNSYNKVSSGVYFYNLKIDDKIIDTKKCLIIK